jgi:oligoribonuclease NrnB/cAMP/cGMP phosphodiesterase (DHH superfamily)
MTMTHTICFHHNDPDGRASGAIVRYALGKDVLLVESDYDKTLIPWENLEEAGRVIVVDFSFPRRDMLRLAEGREFIWIDHHKSAILEFEKIGRSWDGIRDMSEAACVLTWRYFFPGQPVPRAVVLIGDRDIWRWAEEDTGAFNESLYNHDHQADHDRFWVPLFDDDRATLDQMIKEGAWLREISLRRVDRLMEARSFEVLFERHKTLAVNASANGDIGDYGRSRGFEVIYCYVDEMQPGGLATNVTLFSDKVDVSSIAKKFGGGGHAGAAGFSFSRGATPFPPDSEVHL